MHRDQPSRPRSPLLALLLCAGACSAIVPDDPKVQLHLGTAVADKFVHRGMPQNRNGTAQGTLDASVPTRWGDLITVGAFANMDLRGSTGSAWFPDGHGGRITEVDLTGTWSHTFESGFAVAAGVQNYDPPYGESFPNGPREQTNELFLRGEKEVLGAQVALEVHKDVDQAQGSYWRIGVDEDFPLSDKFTLFLGSHLGWSSRLQSAWNYGLDNSGLADLGAQARLIYAYDDHTAIGVSFDATTIVDSGLRDWFGLIGVERDNYWLSVFVDWNF